MIDEKLTDEDESVDVVVTVDVPMRFKSGSAISSVAFSGSFDADSVVGVASVTDDSGVVELNADSNASKLLSISPRSFICPILTSC